MNYTHAELRRHLLESDDVIAFPGLTPSELANTQRLWHELRAVEQVNAWGAVVTSAGQILEAGIKHKLVQHGVPRSELESNHGTLGAITNRAYKEGIYPRPGQDLRVGGSIFTAKQIRNMAAHASPWHHRPSELRATWSLVLSVCYLGYLFTVIGHEPDEDNPSIAADTDHDRGVDLDDFVRLASPRMLSRAITEALGDRDQVRLLRSSIERNFRFVLANAGAGRVKNVEDLVVRLAQLGLRAVHSQALAVTLPQDAGALGYLLMRSPNRCARYMYMCRRADPEMFDQVWSGKSAGMLEKRLTTSIVDHSISIQNVGKLLALVSPQLRHSVLTETGAELAAWVSQEPASSSVGLLTAWAEEPDWTSGVANLVQALASNIEASAPEGLPTIPLRLDQLRIIDRPELDPVVQVLIARAPDLATDDAQRVLWDLLAFAPRHQHEVLDGLRSCLDQAAHRKASPLDVLALAGAIFAVGESVRVPLSTSRALEATELLSDNLDRFRIARIILAIKRMGGRRQLSPTVKTYVLRRIAGTQVPPGISRDLIAEARRICS